MKENKEKISLPAKIRNIFGKKVKKLRKEGLIPATVYGVNFKSKSISVNKKEFIKVYRLAKETKIINLQIEKEEIPVLIKNIQIHPITNEIIHVDFRKIDLTKTLITEVPIKLTGTSEAVNQKGGVLLVHSHTIVVEALPQDLPQNIEIDISILKEIGQEIKVSDLPKSEKYKIKTPSDKVLVSITAHKEEKTTPDTSTITPEITKETKTDQKENQQVNTSENSKPKDAK